MAADYPLPSFHFQVEWGGTKIGFSKIKNLAMRTNVIENRHGASPEYITSKQPGDQTYENFFLERTVFNGDNEFYDWWKETKFLQEGESTGSIFRRDITISLLNENHEPIIVWKIKNAMPVRLSWSDLDAKGNDLLTETLEVACEGIVIQND